MPTKAATQALNELQEKFPDLKAGIHNCRKIAGTSRYSEHSSGNALDIYHKDYGYSTNKTHQAWLDTVDAFIRQYMVQLSIRNRIWRARNHYNHIHLICPETLNHCRNALLEQLLWLDQVSHKGIVRWS